MPELHLLAVGVTTVVAVLFSGAYYSVLATQLAAVSPVAAAGEPPTPLGIAAEVVRSTVLVTVIAAIVVQTGTDSWTGGLWLGLGLFVGFPLVLWAGAVLHEKQDLRLAAIHGGDWLLKVPIATVILSVWQ
jgi:hypothetical protein